MKNDHKRCRQSQGWQPPDQDEASQCKLQSDVILTWYGIVINIFSRAENFRNSHIGEADVHTVIVILLWLTHKREFQSANK
jgi:hypothetical protein